MHEKEMVMPSNSGRITESFEERQLRLLESIDRKLGKLLDRQTVTITGVARQAVAPREPEGGLGQVPSGGYFT